MVVVHGHREQTKDVKSHSEVRTEWLRLEQLHFALDHAENVAVTNKLECCGCLYFKKRFETHPSMLLVSLRIEEATDLLSGTFDPVAEFPDPSTVNLADRQKYSPDSM